MKLSHGPVSSDVIHVRSGKLHSLMADAFCVPVELPQLRYEKLSLDRKNNSAGWPLGTGWHAVVMLAAFSSMLPSVYVSHIYYALKVKKKCEWCFLFCPILEQYKCQTISQYVIDT